MEIKLTEKQLSHKTLNRSIQRLEKKEKHRKRNTDEKACANSSYQDQVFMKISLKSA
jgi:hypothetical protein